MGISAENVDLQMNPKDDTENLDIGGTLKL